MNKVKFNVTREDGKNYSGTGILFTEALKKELVDDYFIWKKINERQEAYGARRLNFPESISEGLGCYSLNLLRTNKTEIKGANSSSCDAIDPNTGLTYQFKACSTVGLNPKGSPSSFGPRSESDVLIYLHMDCEEDKMYFYEFNENINGIRLNATETFKDQCDKGLRPRFNLLPIIKRDKIPYFGYFDYKTGEYVKCLD